MAVGAVVAVVAVSAVIAHVHHVGSISTFTIISFYFSRNISFVEKWINIVVFSRINVLTLRGEFYILTFLRIKSFQTKYFSMK